MFSPRRYKLSARYAPNIPAPITTTSEGSAIAATSGQGAAPPAAQHIVRERSLLNIDLDIGIGIKSWEHAVLRFSLAAPLQMLSLDFV
jgi:hypothetical protein